MEVWNLIRFSVFFFFFNLFWFLSNYASLTTANLSDDNGNITNSTSLPPSSPPIKRSSSNNPFKPGIAIIVATLTTIFSITFLLLLYVKHCRTPTNSTYSNNAREIVTRKNSGINRKVIESLPIFRFSSLRGQKDGLECAVCLTRFDSDEVLRLLPKCKHAFHVECVDTWLDAHSTCPLCRYRVDPEDILLIDYSNQTTPRDSDHQAKGIGVGIGIGNGNGNGKGKEFVNPRVSGRHSSAGERGNSLEIIVENPATANYRSRSSADSWNSRRKTWNNKHNDNTSSCKSLDSWKSTTNPKNQGRKSFDSWKSSSSTRQDGQLPVQQNDKHRLEHRIIISAAADDDDDEQRRWSDVQAADFLYLKTEMIMGGGGGGEEEVRESGRGVINGRSVSEITGMSRYKGNNGGGKREERERQEEGAVKRWMDWISHSQQQQQNTAVRSASLSSSTSAAIVV